MEFNIVFCVIQHDFESYHHSYLLNDTDHSILGFALNLSEEFHYFKLCIGILL